jgi:hypothetical protein
MIYRVLRMNAVDDKLYEPLKRDDLYNSVINSTAKNDAIIAALEWASGASGRVAVVVAEVQACWSKAEVQQGRAPAPESAKRKKRQGSYR